MAEIKINRNKTLRHPFLDFPKENFIRLQLFLPLTFIVLIGLTSFAVAFLSNYSATLSIKELAITVMARVSHKALEKTAQYLDSALHTVRLNQLLLQKLPGFKERFESDPFRLHFSQITARQLELFPYFGLIYFGDQQGNHWLNKREQDGLVRTRIIRRLLDDEESRIKLKRAAEMSKHTEADRLEVQKTIAPYIRTTWFDHSDQGVLSNPTIDPLKIYDTRQRPWYIGAKKNKDLYWTDVYTWEDRYKGQVRRQVGITVSAPVYLDGKLMGVTALDIVLNAISEFLGRMDIMDHGRAFIINSQGQVVGFPQSADKKENAQYLTDEGRLIHINRVSDWAIAKSYRTLRRSLDLANKEAIVLKKGQVIPFAALDEPYFGYFTPFYAGYNLDWIVGVVVPERDFLEQFQERMWMNWALSTGGIIFMIMVSIWVSRKIIIPLTQLTQEVVRITHFKVEEGLSCKTFFQELGFMDFLLNQMKASLRNIYDQINHDVVLLDDTDVDIAKEENNPHRRMINKIATDLKTILARF